MRGAVVTLIAGPTTLRSSPGIKRINIETAEEMLNAVRGNIETADVLIMSAAVADYTPARVASNKLKKETSSLALQLSPTTDILLNLSATKGKRIHIGFALETENGLENARKKLAEKNLDIIVLNSAAQAGAGIGADTNIITLIDSGGETTDYPMMSKHECARVIVERVAGLV